MLELKNVCSGYGKKQVLRDVSATFKKGEITSIIGPNGCGKSTLLKTIIGALPLTQGDILIDGKSICGMKSKNIARQIAYMPQSRNIPDMTVGQLVLHGRFAHLDYPRVYSENDKKIAAEAMRETGVLHLANERLDTLSGGMRQNAYIAMTLAQNTDYILTDEPTTYLDISNGLQLMKKLKELASGGKGVIMVMHDIALAMRCSDKIAVMSDGVLEAFDTRENVFNSGVIDKVFGVRLKRTETYNGYQYFFEQENF